MHKRLYKHALIHLYTTILIASKCCMSDDLDMS